MVIVPHANVESVTKIGMKGYTARLQTYRRTFINFADDFTFAFGLSPALGRYFTLAFTLAPFFVFVLSRLIVRRYKSEIQYSVLTSG